MPEAPAKVRLLPSKKYEPRRPDAAVTLPPTPANDGEKAKPQQPGPRANGHLAPDAELGREPDLEGPAPAFPGCMSGEELMTLVLPPLQWLLWHIIPAGYVVFGGPPKLGKSWLCLQVALAVAAAGQLFGQDAQQAPVLVLALEDGKRRAQSRMEKLLDGKPMPAGIAFRFECPKLNNGGLEFLEAWAKAHPRGVIILDTFAKVRPPARPGANAYDADSEIHAPLHRICHQHGVTIIAVTHLRKSRGEDWVEAISGSMGISGTADTIMVLERQRGSPDGVLRVTGRDADEQQLALRFDKDTGRWSCLGDAAVHRGTENTRKVLQALKAGGPAGITPNEVVDRTQINRGTVKSTLFRLAEKGDAVSTGKGRYALPVH